MEAPAAGPRSLVVVKLGGSLLTRKKEVEKLRPKVLVRLAEELADSRPVPLLLLHGAGSFGHPSAARFGLARAPAGPPAERARGGAIVSAEVRRLHLAVLRALVNAGAAPWSVPVANLARNREGALAELELRPFTAALERGLLPVAFGDVVPDDSWGLSILSADTLAVELAGRLAARRVVFATDVPGLLEGAPGSRRTVVAEVSEATVAALEPTSGATDVTGGIGAKLRAMLRIARGGADAALISGLTGGAVSRAVRGESVYGSWAHARTP